MEFSKGDKVIVKITGLGEYPATVINTVGDYMVEAEMMEGKYFVNVKDVRHQIKPLTGVNSSKGMPGESHRSWYMSPDEARKAAAAAVVANDPFSCCNPGGECDPEPHRKDSMLVEAAKLIHGQRAKDYGDASESFGRIATMWGAYLGRSVTPVQVADMMSLLKLARLAQSPNHRDSRVDVCGYQALTERLNDADDQG